MHTSHETHSLTPSKLPLLIRVNLLAVTLRPCLANLLLHPSLVVLIPDLACIPITVHKPKPRAIPIPTMHGRIMIRIPTIIIRPTPPSLGSLGRADGCIIPSAVQVVLVPLAANALAAVADEEKTADSHRNEDDNEAEDWDGDYHGEIHVGGNGCWRGEGHAGGEEDLGEDAGWGDGEGEADCSWEVAVVADGFEDWFVC